MQPVRGERRYDGGVPDAAYAVVPAPWGAVHAAATERGIVAVESLATTASFVRRLAARLHGRVRPGGTGSAAAIVERTAQTLAEYLAGHAVPWDQPLDLADRPAWDRAVLDSVRTVPWGSVTSYGRVARRIGRPGAARAVGGAIGRNPIGIVVPCHRVVSGDGTLGGYGGDAYGERDVFLDIKRELLRLERVTLPAASLVD